VAVAAVVAVVAWVLPRLFRKIHMALPPHRPVFVSRSYSRYPGVVLHRASMLHRTNKNL
jgi:hypothetical protein